MGKAIGIDLGTTNSCVAVIEGGKPVIIPNDKGSRTTPSVVAFTKDGERLVGENAVRQTAVNAERTVSSIKRRMGTDWNIKIDGKRFAPQEISAMILRKLRQDAESYLGESVTDAVITVPAYFNDIQRQATKDAGRIAGLNVLRIINEPTSAALAYGLDNGTAQKIMVYDLGGGTFDVSIIEIGEGVIEVLATNGDNHLGGDDFDEILASHFVSEFRRQNNYDVSRDVTAMQRIREAAEQAKKELSSAETARVSLPYIAQIRGNVVHFEYTLTRAKFNELTARLVDRTEGPVRNALSDAGIAASELGRVLLVGGSTRIPAVQQKVAQLTGKTPSKNINPDECVAQGAAIQAETLSGKAMQVSGGGLSNTAYGNGILLLDVTPLSLSIETLGGVATRLVERNSTLPVHYSQIFTTAAPFQSSVDIHVLQGERPMAADNRTIGKFRLNGIKRAMAGVPQIEVTFDIDTNGILKVSAKDLDTGREQSITITADERMSDSEISAAIRDAEKYQEQDSLRKEAMTVHNDANMLLAKTDRALRRVRKQLPKEEKNRIRTEISELRRVLMKNDPKKMTREQIGAVQDAMRRLEDVSLNMFRMAEYAPDPEPGETDEDDDT